jgi:hypothetical protein
MDNNDNKRGFSGLSDLASELSSDIDVISSEQKSDVKPSSDTQNPSSTSRESPRNEPERKSPTSSVAIETVSSGRSTEGSGWKLILGIFGLLVVIWIANNGGHETKRSSLNTPSPTHNKYKGQHSHGTLAREIENGKIRAKQMEIQIRNMDDRLEEYKRRLGNYKSLGMIDEYNGLVPLFNALVNERNNLYEDYSRLIDEVNAKVKRYNSGYR